MTRIAFVSRELFPFGGGGLGASVAAGAAILSDVAEVTVVTTDAHEQAYRDLREQGSPLLPPPSVRMVFAPEPTVETTAKRWYSTNHLWSAGAYEALKRAFPDGGPDLVEFPDHLGEACVAVQAKQTADPALRHTAVLVRLYTSAEMAQALNGHLHADTPNRMLFELERYALRRADGIVTPGGDVLGTYECFYGAGRLAAATTVRQPFLAPWGAAAVAPPHDGPLRMLYAGRIERRKGVQNLVRAVTGLDRDDWSLALVGADTDTGPLGVSLRAQLALAVDGDERISLLPPVPRTELPELLGGADLVVLPSLWECWPVTGLEALSAGRPLLATPTGGFAEIVQEGRSGWLSRDVSAGALAEAVGSLLDRAEEVRGLIGSGGPRAVFEELVDADGVRERYLALARRSRRRRPPRRESPLVSVVVPYHRLEAFVGEAVRSAAGQTYGELEIVVVNDGSFRDEDRRVLDGIAAHYPVSVLTQPNSGLGAARNFGIRQSRGRYVLPLDADNALSPGFVERCVDVLEADPDVAYVTSWLLFVDEDGRAIESEWGYHPIGNDCGALDLVNAAGDAAAVVRRGVFDLGFWYSEAITSYEDWLFYRRLAQSGLHGHVIPEPLVRYRVRGDSMAQTVGIVNHERLLGEIRAELRAAEVEWIRPGS